MKLREEKRFMVFDRRPSLRRGAVRWQAWGESELVKLGGLVHAAGVKTAMTLLLALGLGSAVLGADILIVADEFPAMELLAAKLKAEENVASTLVWQTNLPPDLGRFSAIVVYIHLGLQEPAEKAMIRYTRAGGKLIALHHSISSGKRKNKEWFPFLGVSLPQGEVSQGGYKWIEPATLEVVNLAPDHFITTHRVKYPAKIPWRSAEGSGAEELLPGFVLKETEVYLNHQLVGPHTILLGFRYADPKSGQVYCQARAGWVRPAERGWIIYLKPGHSGRDFEEPAYARLVANAVMWRP
jgi:hypothetical protein